MTWSGASSGEHFLAANPASVLKASGPDPWYDVTAAAYGAKGDGVTDDKAAIQLAINAATANTGGGIVFFPTGTYKIGSALTDFTNVQYIALAATFTGTGGTSIAVTQWASTQGASFNGPDPWFDVRAWGAKGDTKGRADGTTTATSTAFSSPAAAFSQATDVGKTIIIAGAGVAAATLVTTIASVQSATALTLSVAASTSIAGTADYDYGTDDTTVLQSMLTHVPASPTTGVDIFFPPGCYLISAGLVPPGLVRIHGSGYSYIAGRANRGASCILKTGNFDAITVGDGVSVENLQVDGASGNGGDGMYMKGARSIAKSVGVTSQGQDGWRIGTKTTGNTNSWRLENVYAASNTRRGIYVHDQQSGGGTPNVNVGVAIGISCRLNGEDGIRTEHSQDSLWLGVDCSSNTGQGWRLVNGAQGSANGQHIIFAYLENNVAGQGLIDNGCTQNRIWGARYANGALTDGWINNDVSGTNDIDGRIGASPWNTIRRSMLAIATDGIGGFPLTLDTVSAATASIIPFRTQGTEKWELGKEGGGAFSLYDTVRGNYAWRQLANDRFTIYAPIAPVSTVPTVGSGGAGTSALSIIAGSTNTSGQFQVTLTAVAPGVVAGVVAFGGGALPTAPKVIVVSLAAPTAGVASPPIVAADTYTTSGFTIRVTGPTTVTTGTYIINWIAFF